MLARLDEWLDVPGEAGWVVLTGGPGMGKSAVLSAWLARREAAGAVVPHHFIRRQVIDWDQPEVIAASLAAQIEAVFPELRDNDAKPEGRLIERERSTRAGGVHTSTPTSNDGWLRVEVARPRSRAAPPAPTWA